MIAAHYDAQGPLLQAAGVGQLPYSEFLAILGVALSPVKELSHIKVGKREDSELACYGNGSLQFSRVPQSSLRAPTASQHHLLWVPWIEVTVTCIYLQPPSLALMLFPYEGSQVKRKTLVRAHQSLWRRPGPFKELIIQAWAPDEASLFPQGIDFYTNYSTAQALSVAPHHPPSEHLTQCPGSHSVSSDELYIP